MLQNTLEKYIELRHEIDAEAKRLEKLHSNEINCKKGCDSCCESLTIFPIEYHNIKSKFSKANLPKKKLKHRFTKNCRFLLNSECSIYNERPIICRTQGLPLLYENMLGTNFELSVCQLNFKKVDVSVFNKENALYMAPFNSRLFLLNKTFIEANQLNFEETKRLKLNNI